MKKIILLSLFIYPFCLFLSQNIKGTVVNDIDKPIANVNIYLDGTKTGTVSAADGTFSLNTTSNNSLVFQKDDYETFIVNTSQVLNKKLKIVLIKAKEIEEVVIIPFTEKAYKNHIYFF
ncbi:carboxypeptidase-like regulatory domain-containing protein [Chryseobacterium indoltheticum]|uniref:carboxypeptidase-like regulatory domain-containing protein n=1 Tax=Chryseobacterium indoltheticum TaxID=254 RepID=UPI003F49201D